MYVASPFEQKLFDERDRIIGGARDKGIILRLLGALAIRTHCEKFSYIHEKANRTLSDLDMAAYLRQGTEITRYFKDAGYKHSALGAIPGLKRAVFLGDGELHVDIFYGGLEMCHDIPFKDRLEIDYPTIPLAELLLEKMQIVQINEKDLIDTIMLLREHDISDNDKDVINGQRVAGLCSEDWGLWRTTTMNLDKVTRYAETFSAINEEDKKDVTKKIRSLLDRVEKQPKSLKWKMRARVGDSKVWYRSVEERA
jgi:hypothetical protein